jgi:hypothetical protein
MPAEKKIWDARWGLRADGSRFQCAYLGADVKLTDEREQHIAENTRTCSRSIMIGLLLPWLILMRFALALVSVQRICSHAGIMTYLVVNML